MIDRHKANPVTFRPPEGDRTWLYAHAKATSQSVGAILTEALAEYRARLDDSEARRQQILRDFAPPQPTIRKQEK